MFGFKKEKEKEKPVTLDDVTPQHPDAYPGQGLRARLDARRATLRDIRDHNHSEAFEDVELGLSD